MSYKEFKRGGYIADNFKIELPKGVEIKTEHIDRMMDDILMIGEPQKENERLKNLLTACYNCDSIKEVRNLIEEEIKNGN